jgi:hypothetical protein
MQLSQYSDELRIGRPGVDSRPLRERDCFSSPQLPYRLLGPPSLLSSGYRGALSPGVKRPVRENDHSPSFSVEVELYPHSHIRLLVVVLK